MVAEGEAVHHFDVWMKAAEDGWVLTRVAPVVASDESGEPVVVHVLEPTDRRDHPEVPDAATTVRSSQGRRFGKLTSRELEVLRLLIDGRNTEEIAGQLFIGTSTVRCHVQSILRKTDTHTRLEVVALARD